VLKDTSIVFAIGLAELLTRGYDLFSEQTTAVLEVILFISAIYFVLTFTTNRALDRLGDYYAIPEGSRRGDDNFLRVADVSKWYGEEQVLRDVSFEMDRGDVTVLIGPSGSGKSTMLRCVNRLAEAQEGSILLDGEEVLSPDLDVNDLRREVGMVFRGSTCSRTSPRSATSRSARAACSGSLGDGGPRPR